MMPLLTKDMLFFVNQVKKTYEDAAKGMQRDGMR